MGVQLDIPDSIIQAIRLPQDRIPQELLIELSVSTYSQGLLSFGKARELAKMGKYEFSQLLGKRGVLRHYSRDDLQDDLTYAGSE